jgi:23S rRNA (uracil1939-C5)-methyltransferase
LTDPLNAIIEPLREFLEQICDKREEGFVHLTDTATGIDCSWSPHRFKKKVVDSDLWQKWSQFGRDHNFAQITRAGKELIVCFRTPMIDISGKLLRFPSAAFLQPSQVSQEAMQKAMLSLLKDRRYFQDNKPIRFLDLFCGLGTFTIPLLPHGSVVSMDCAGQSLASLKEHQGTHLSIHERDLMSHPLSAQELKPFDIIILDPPRVGAYTQVQIIAKHFQGPVLMISCDLATAARDAQEMTAGGYTLSQCLLFDQFPYTAHLEGMLLFERK